MGSTSTSTYSLHSYSTFELQLQVIIFSLVIKIHSYSFSIIYLLTYTTYDNNHMNHYNCIFMNHNHIHIHLYYINHHHLFPSSRFSGAHMQFSVDINIGQQPNWQKRRQKKLKNVQLIASGTSLSCSVRAHLKNSVCEMKNEISGILIGC